MTNSEFIRSMTDEDLAHFISDDVLNVPWCDIDAQVDENKNCLKWDGTGDCTRCAFQWLQREAANEDGIAPIAVKVKLSEKSIRELKPCPKCGEKPNHFMWRIGNMDMRCSCGMHGSIVNYEEDENNLVKIFEELKAGWNTPYFQSVIEKAEARQESAE